MSTPNGFSGFGSATGSSQTVYSVTINAVGNGTVTADPTSATYGQTVTLTVTPDSEDYILRSLTVTTAGGDLVDVADNAFTMPRSSVTITPSPVMASAICMMTK